MLAAVLSACCSFSSQAPREPLAGTGLPSDLLARQRQLEALQLPAGIEDLRWLTAPLRILSAQHNHVDVLDDLPDTIEELDVSYSTIRNLRRLPDRLRTLDLNGTSVSNLGRLPAHLTAIKLGDAVRVLPPLPEGLSDLDLELIPVLPPWEIYVLGNVPAALRSLSLTGFRIERLNALPATLRSLRLSNTNLGSLPPLPAGLQSLDLDNNTHLRQATLPRFIAHLSVRAEALPDLKDLHYLRSLSLVTVGLPQNPLPETIEVLALDAQGEIPAWPPRLKALALRRLRKQRLPALPAGIESLDLTGSEIEFAGGLPSSIRRLTINLRELSTIRSLLPGLEKLDVSDSEVTDFDGLQAATRLKELVLCGSNVLAIKELPQSLIHLELCDSPRLTLLPALPAQLESLNVSRTPLTQLPLPLPRTLTEVNISNTRIPLSAIKNLENLRSLTLSVGQASSLADLPPTVTRLSFVEATH